MANLYRWFIQKWYYEPLFKAKCDSCGKKLKIDLRIPHVSNDLLIRIGDHVTFNGINSFNTTGGEYAKPELIIGDYSYIGFHVNCNIGKHITIGKHCLTAARVLITDIPNFFIDLFKKDVPNSMLKISPVVIEDNVWLGYQSVIGPGVRVSEGSIVGANSVVLSDVPPYSIVSGVPAKVIRFIK